MNTNHYQNENDNFQTADEEQYVPFAKRSRFLSWVTAILLIVSVLVPMKVDWDNFALVQKSAQASEGGESGGADESDESDESDDEQESEDGDDDADESNDDDDSGNSDDDSSELEGMTTLSREKESELLGNWDDE